MEIAGVHCTGPLGNWAPMLHHWIGLVSRFPGRGKDEELVRAPYWYTERANVGLLAGAALLSGWVALEEFHHDKVKDTDKSFKGRLDLWLRQGGLSWAIEAKQCWPRLKDSGTGESAKKSLKTAEKAASITFRGHKEGVHRVGVSFSVPSFPKGTKEPVVSEAIAHFVEDVRVEFGGDSSGIPTTPAEGEYRAQAIAWAFPDHLRELAAKSDGRIYPGVVLIAKVTKEPE